MSFSIFLTFMPKTLRHNKYNSITYRHKHFWPSKDGSTSKQYKERLTKFVPFQQRGDGKPANVLPWLSHKTQLYCSEITLVTNQEFVHNFTSIAFNFIQPLLKLPLYSYM